MSKHTPGPWGIHPNTTNPAVQSVGTADVGPKRICGVGGNNMKNATDLANARLIAATPELLRALQGATALLQSIRSTPAGAKLIADHAPAWFGLGHCTAALFHATGDEQ